MSYVKMHTAGIWEELVLRRVGGAPSIMEMDAWYGAAWRSDRRAADAGEKQGLAGLYLFNKTIVLSALRFIPDSVPVDMVMMVKLADFESMLREE
ncbi:hypothetical protein DFQ27_001130 [Actinomortierella ambigua]|uniref:Uncharacterized protein n=1 Tax=Actinomortierella ambigua TaxID=1343610 RepID=A0A9P6TVC3_9FUNG|nr:hypothetical protein DFQ27_001130 [Actinomortierella ambigua]